MTPQLKPADFLLWRDAASPALPIVLDVRENWELQTASVQPNGFTLLHIPMGEITAKLAELQDTHGSDQAIACLCHHGIRSQRVASFLAHHGFAAVVNLAGGIDAWSSQFDSRVPRY